MKEQQQLPGWITWLWEKGFIAVSAIALMFAVILMSMVYLIDQRISRLDQPATQTPPTKFQAADLKKYRTDVAADSLPVKQVEYVPVYSHVYFSGGRPMLLESTLSLRNTDQQNSVFIESVHYYDTDGKLVQEYVDNLIELKPLATVEFLVPMRNTAGGSGANFLVHWRSQPGVSPPLVEAIMVGAAGNQAISFRTEGRRISSGSGTPGQ